MSAGAIAFSFRRRDASLSADAADRARRSSLKRSKLSAFDVSIVALWIGATVTLSFSNMRQGAPQVIKVLMTPGLLLMIYGLVWVAQKAWGKRGEQESR